MNDIIPISYKLHLEPDISRFTFSGSVEILMEAKAKVREVTLNALDLEILNCGIILNNMLLDCPFTTNTQKEEIIIALPEKAGKKIILRIDFMGTINEKMMGFYRSRYMSEGKPKYLATTQFEESDARRAFPCFDHPRHKASFDVEMIINNEQTAISNCPILKERTIGDFKKCVQFKRTPKMSTYLLFFGVGEFSFIKDQGDVVVRVATQPGLEKQGEFGLQFGRKALEFCQQYFDVDYPLPKLDLISVPDFAFGAMENWGAITFRENLLLHYPGITSKAGEERICEVIAHEIAHQWFGNLVTPSDWKYLWLNESFATYFGYGVVNHYYPEWDMWQQFLYSQTHKAMDRDALRETTSIEIPGGDHVIINSSTAPIIYNKGGSVLRQVEGYIGKENFKRGLQGYLRKYQYSCASSRHLWESLEEASNMPVTTLMKSWIEQPGFPMVHVQRSGHKLLLRQEKFSYLPIPSSQRWLIPVTIRFFDKDHHSETVSILFRDEILEMDISQDIVTYKLNDAQMGFYRVMYHDEDNFHRLGEKVWSKALPPEDRWGLQNDLYALVKSGKASLTRYLRFVSNYDKEDAFLPISGIADNLFHAFLITEGKKRKSVAATAKSFLEKILTEIGYAPRPEEKHTNTILRDQIIWQAVLYGSKEMEAFALTKFEMLMKGASIHSDIIKSIMRIGALKGNQMVFDWFDKRLHASESEHERMNILVAMASFRDLELIETVLNYVLNKVPDRNKFVPITSMADNPYAAPHMWDWYRSQLDKIELLHPIHYERIVSAIIPMCGIDKKPEVEQFFKEHMDFKKISRDVIRLSLEKLEINHRMRERAGQG